jgi:DNA excision repair protein ERCC-4
LFREGNKTGFIKAISDRPDLFSSGFAQVEKIMRNLFVKRLYLWPRFRASVQESLDANVLDAVEVSCDLSPKMLEIQETLVDVIDSCFSELKRCRKKSINADWIEIEDDSEDKNIFRRLDSLAKRQLDSVWHQMGSKTKQLVSDLGALRKMLEYLLCYDCISFHELLTAFRTSTQAQQSLWMYTESASRLFTLSKSRVYSLRPKKESGSDDSKSFVVSPNLDLNPKWKLLKDILEEIQGTLNSSASLPRKVLVFVADKFRSHQVQKVLTCGDHKFLDDLWYSFLKRQSSPSSQSLEQNAINNALLMMESNPSSSYHLESYTRNKRRKTLKHKKKGCISFKDISIAEAYPHDSNQLADIDIVVCSFDERGSVVENFSPSFVVMFDLDLEVFRELENFNSSLQDHAFRIYFLVYEGSLESNMYTASVERETGAFEALIQQKAIMIVPENQDGKICIDQPQDVQGPRIDEVLSASVATRKAGGRNPVAIKPGSKIIVDMREFRSSLPGSLHKRGFQVIPATLEVGDYILSPNISIERKSIPDLLGSLSSGRLYNQLVLMSKHYGTPALLIEFDPDKSFSLVSESSIGEDIQQSSVTSKMSILILHFPFVRLLWSRGPHNSAEIFQVLKQNQEEPNPETAVCVGIEGNNSSVGEDDSNALSVLAKLPGINSTTATDVRRCREISSLLDLINMSQKNLAQVIGSANASSLNKFCTAKITPAIE